jgi:hypothetical protein
MTRTETTGKPPVLVWTIHMKSAIVPSSVAHPVVVSRVHVWHVRVARLITEILFAMVVRFASTWLLIPRILLRMRSGVVLHSSTRRALLPAAAFRAMRRDMSGADLAAITRPMFLGGNDEGQAQQTR